MRMARMSPTSSVTGQALLTHVRLFHVARRSRRAVPGNIRLATQPMIDERRGGNRAADEPALPARRRIDELLQLGPAVRLGEDALADGMGQRIDGDPVSSLAGGSPQELPGALRVVGDQSLEEAEGKPARLELLLAEQA